MWGPWNTNSLIPSLRPPGGHETQILISHSRLCQASLAKESEHGRAEKHSGSRKGFNRVVASKVHAFKRQWVPFQISKIAHASKHCQESKHDAMLAWWWHRAVVTSSWWTHNDHITWTSWWHHDVLGKGGGGYWRLKKIGSPSNSFQNTKGTIPPERRPMMTTLPKKEACMSSVACFLTPKRASKKDRNTSRQPKNKIGTPYIIVSHWFLLKLSYFPLN